MRIDITTCNKVNVADTCAMWNILSSQVLYSVLDEQSFTFCCTQFVVYECLYRSRATITAAEEAMKKRFGKLIDTKKVSSHQLTIEDLQDDDILANRKSLGRGELSSIAFAKKTQLYFLTDDQKARKIAESILGSGKVQTTPQLFGWLLYEGYLTDGDLEPIIEEHNISGRPLESYLREVHAESWRIKLLTR